MNLPLKELLSQGQLWFGRKQSHRTRSLSAVFGVDAVDSHLPGYGLAAGAVHELTFDSALTSKGKNIWQPASCVLSAVLGNTLASLEDHLLEQKPVLAWVGEKSWPTPYLIDLFLKHPHWSWEKNCLFLSPSKGDLLWTVTQLLHSPACLGVIADGSSFNLIATRRLQLAAQKHNAFCFLHRPVWDLKRPSAAQTRWRIQAHTAEIESPLKTLWQVELANAKGAPCPVTWHLQLAKDYEQKVTLSLVQEHEGSDRASAAVQERLRAVGV